MSEPVETEQEEKGAHVRFPPPLVPLFAFAASFGLDAVLGPIAEAPASAVRWGLGGLLLVAGLGLLAAAAGLFRKTGQDPKPWKPAPELIAEGIYQWTRNPMYLGMGLLQAALGILFGTLWAVVLVPVTWFVIYRIAIRHEEAYLREKFGADYEAYCGRVRRWL